MKQSSKTGSHSSNQNGRAEKKTFGAQHNGYNVSTQNGNEPPTEFTVLQFQTNPSSYNERPHSCCCAEQTSPPPPPPLPPCSEATNELWDLQFCRWWGWNWVKKREEIMNQQLKESRSYKEPTRMRSRHEMRHSKRKKRGGCFNNWFKTNLHKNNCRPALNDCEKKQLQDLYETPCSSVTFNSCMDRLSPNKNLECKSLNRQSCTNTSRNISQATMCCKCNMKTESLICEKSESTIHRCCPNNSTSSNSSKEYFTLRLKGAKSEMDPNRMPCTCRNACQKPKTIPSPQKYTQRCTHFEEEPREYPILCKTHEECHPPCCYPKICKPKPNPCLQLYHHQPDCILRVPKEVHNIHYTPLPKYERIQKHVCSCQGSKQPAIKACCPREKKTEAGKNCPSCHFLNEKEYVLCVREKKKKAKDCHSCCCCRCNGKDGKLTDDKNEGTSKTSVNRNSNDSNNSNVVSDNNQQEMFEKGKVGKVRNDNKFKSPASGKKYTVSPVETFTSPLGNKLTLPSPMDPWENNFLATPQSFFDDEHKKLLRAVSEALLAARSLPSKPEQNGRPNRQGQYDWLGQKPYRYTLHKTFPTYDPPDNSENNLDFSIMETLLEEKCEEMNKSTSNLGTVRKESWEGLSQSSHKTTSSSNTNNSKRRSELLLPSNLVRSAKFPKMSLSGLLAKIEENSKGLQSTSRLDMKVETFGEDDFIKINAFKSSKIPILNKRNACRRKIKVKNGHWEKVGNSSPIINENLERCDQSSETSSFGSSSNLGKFQHGPFKMKYAEMRAAERNNFESGVMRKIRRSDATPTTSLDRNTYGTRLS